MILNKCIFTGNLGKDPAVEYTGGGTAVATMSLCVNSKIKKGEEWVDDVFYVDCIIFGKRAEAMGKNLSKGSKILVEGRMRTRTWEYEGKKHYKTELMADNVEFLSPKKESGQQLPASMGDAPGLDETVDLEPF
jgi:single-strand DNA-binding protein